MGLSKKRKINWNTNGRKMEYGMLKTTCRDQNGYVSLKIDTISAINSVLGYRENQDSFCHVEPQAGYGLCSLK